MVIFFKSVDPTFTIYMGKDKYENEELIKYGLPIDIWFHVEGLSSAHVYLRLPDGITMENIPSDVLQECLQLVKENSRDGRKKDSVSVCYTPWENLYKSSSMDVGEVGFKDELMVKVVNGIEKNNDVLKQLKKTMEDKVVNLEAEKESFQIELNNKKKKFYEEQVRLFIINIIVEKKRNRAK